MERDLIGFDLYLDVFLVGTPSNTLLAPLTVMLVLVFMEVVFVGLVLGKYTVVQSNYIFEFHNP